MEGPPRISPSGGLPPPPSGQPNGPQPPSSSNSPPSGPVPPFVQQLARMLQEGHIAWSDAGDEVVVADTKRFADEVCPLYFKHRNWTSFARMMNMYDFVKTPDGAGARFRHPHFRRGADNERWRVQRRRSTTKKRPSTDNTDVWVRRGLVLERRVAKLAEENAKRRVNEGNATKAKAKANEVKDATATEHEAKKAAKGAGSKAKGRTTGAPSPAAAPILKQGAASAMATSAVASDEQAKSGGGGGSTPKKGVSFTER